MTRVIAKFGGSSVRDAKSISNCVQLVKNNSKIDLVIVSATFNTTNELEELAHLAKSSSPWGDLLGNLEKRHFEIVKELKNSAVCNEFISSIVSEIQEVLVSIKELTLVNPELMDSLYSKGEKISSFLFREFLNEELSERSPQLVDVQKVLKTSDDFGMAMPILDEIKANALKEFKPGPLYVTQGFIGSTLDGRTTTLGREGSDYSATLLAEALEVSEVQIWTDVPGIFTCDPKKLNEAKQISHLHYDEAGTMAKLGSKILFSKTLNPVVRKSIPVFVGSSQYPNEGGTLINGEKKKSNGVTGISCFERGGNYVVSLIGDELFGFKIDLPEIDQTENSRSFLVDAAELEKVLTHFHNELVKS